MIVKNLGKIFIIALLHLQLLADVTFSQKVSKENIHLNETIKVTLQLKVDNDDKIDQIYFEEYDTYQFWITSLVEKIEKKDENFTTYTYEYLLEPKKEGLYRLDEQMIKISSKKIRDRKRWLKIYSNPINIKVLPLYNNLPIQGERYAMEVVTDKTVIKANESINLTLKIEGKGNLKDIQKFEIPLKEQTVFSDTPTVNSKFTDTNYEGEVNQKFLIITDKSFTIPSIELEYYNPISKEIQKTVTKPLYIEVLQKTLEPKDELWMKYIFGLLGIIIGGLLVTYYKKLYNVYKVRKLPLYNQIKSTKNEKDLYQVLVQHNVQSQFEDVIKKLEFSLYKSDKEKIYSFKELQKLALKCNYSKGSLE